MSEIPYRDVVEGAKFLMRLSMEKQLKLIELIMRSVPASVDETVKRIVEEVGSTDLEAIREVLAFTLAVIKGLARKDPAEVVKDLRRMGFTERSARAIVEKIMEELPSAEKDAELLRELDDEALTRLLETWVRFFTGDYRDFDDWSREAMLSERYLLAASRFMESALKSVLSGDMSLRRLREALVEDYGFEASKASRLTEALGAHMDQLFKVMLFKYLKRILDAIE